MEPSTTDLFDVESIPGLGWVAVLLVFVTGVLHVYSGLAEGRIPVVLAGLGFFVAIVLYGINYRRRALYLVGVLYTGIQIPIWYVVKAGSYTVVGYADKAVQVALILVLSYLYWRSRSNPAERNQVD